MWGAPKGLKVIYYAENAMTGDVVEVICEIVEYTPDGFTLRVLEKAEFPWGETAEAGDELYMIDWREVEPFDDEVDQDGFQFKRYE